MQQGINSKAVSVNNFSSILLSGYHWTNCTGSQLKIQDLLNFKYFMVTAV